MNNQNNGPGKREVEDMTPDAIEAEKTRQQAADLAQEQHKARGVDWVRPTDLMARHSAVVAGRGIDFQAELSRRTRTGIATGARAVGAGAKALAERAKQLPPLSAFGRRTSSREPVTRGAVGKS
ncbi:hypothetical protein ACQ3I4_14630 [Zafaria sp. Z1313]|uniref:hypothetical protein n=1 Tax=Micrococcales TaxID=85006 RepID=UPI003B77AE3E